MNRWLGLVIAIALVACDKEKIVEGQIADLGVDMTRRSDAGADASVVRPLQFERITLQGDPEALTEFKFIPGTDDFLMLLKGGEVIHYRLAGTAATRIGSFTVPSVYSESDCGLVSLAFDPAFESNHQVYFGYCDSHDFSRISRHMFDANDYSTIASSNTQIIRVGIEDAPEAWHNIGAIGFDPNGHMWALFGDKAVGVARSMPAHLRSSYLGKVLRFNPHRDSAGYDIVGDNPFVSDENALGEIAAMGLRSPWRGALDSRGRLWIGDVGPDVIEEVNVVRFMGEDLGWPTWQGPCLGNCTWSTDPVLYWDRSAEHPYSLDDDRVVATSRRVVWIGLEYQGGAQDRYEGSLTHRMLVGDFCAGFLRAVEMNEAGEVTYNEHVGHLEGMTSSDVGRDGYVYIATYGSCLTFPYRPGELYRVK